MAQLFPSFSGSVYTAVNRAKVNRSKQYLSQVEKGKIRLSYELAVKIAIVMGTSTDAMFLCEGEYKEDEHQ